MYPVFLLLTHGCPYLSSVHFIYKRLSVSVQRLCYLPVAVSIYPMFVLLTSVCIYSMSVSLTSGCLYLSNVCINKCLYLFHVCIIYKWLSVFMQCSFSLQVAVCNLGTPVSHPQAIISSIHKYSNIYRKMNQQAITIQVFTKIQASIYHFHTPLAPTTPCFGICTTQNICTTTENNTACFSLNIMETINITSPCNKYVHFTYSHQLSPFKIRSILLKLYSHLFVILEFVLYGYSTLK